MTKPKPTAFDRYVARLMLDPKFRAAFEKERRAIKERERKVRERRKRARNRRHRKDSLK